MISAQQIRSARALLGLSTEDLALMAKVGWATIRRFEAADGIPASRSGNLEKVRAALEAQGIRFFGDPISSPGVQLIRPK
jgi:ribosome-binding protein aMBF1 (putative translation factor)